MLNIFRKKDKSEDDSNQNQARGGWFSRLTSGLSKTRHKLSEQVTSLFLGKKSIDANLLEELENILIGADLGVSTTHHILNTLTAKIERKQLNDPEALFNALKVELTALLEPCQKTFETDTHQPFVMLMVGINGAGKTTTIGKLAHHFQTNGKHVMLAAGDTFRAAAVEQLQAWGERNQIPVIAQSTGADSASVIYDAVQAAKARNIDIILADTAGRLHTKSNLMEELKKVKRVINKAEASAPHEIILVLDASIGQNALNQVKEFHDAVGLSALVITKLDGTAKGGIVFAIAEQFKIPIAFIGVGESIEDLQVFNPKAFVDALFGE
ncbi:MAG: ftsY [Gammaproteobacteria bacterium]|jgi:fused signal recognition particle receptor|nr:ftsY [Gammaproteobacteria bacterium]